MFSYGYKTYILGVTTVMELPPDTPIVESYETIPGAYVCFS